MSIDTEKPTAPATTTARADGPIGRVAAGSLAAGAAAALVLTLAVFPGATESTITGSLLSAFGVGWALLGSLSGRLTNLPQRWAKAPALAMSLTGLALLVLRPGDAVLTALNWVWPLPLLALAVWMRKQQHAAAPRRVRRLLAPVNVALVLASLGAMSHNVVALRDASDPAPGELYTVNGHQVHLDCSGDDEPTTVLFNGLGGSSAAWARITSRVAPAGRVCAYDRPGQGWSDATPEPQDAGTAARDLHDVLAQAGLEGPYVLAGHSTGGPFALTYAATYPDEVAGMVLVDSSSPDQFSLPAYPRQYAMLRRGLALTPTLGRLGLGHLGSANQRDEISVLPQVFEQSKALTTLGSVPLAVVTAAGTATSTEGWTEAQHALSLLSDDHVERLVESSHDGMLEEQPAATEVAQAITEVLVAVRAHTRLSPR